MQRYVFPATFSIVAVIFPATFIYFYAFFLTKFSISLLFYPNTPAKRLWHLLFYPSPVSNVLPAAESNVPPSTMTDSAPRLANVMKHSPKKLEFFEETCTSLEIFGDLSERVGDGNRTSPPAYENKYADLNAIFGYFCHFPLIKFGHFICKVYFCCRKIY